MHPLHQPDQRIHHRPDRRAPARVSGHAATEMAIHRGAHVRHLRQHLCGQVRPGSLGLQRQHGQRRLERVRQVLRGGARALHRAVVVFEQFVEMAGQRRDFRGQARGRETRRFAAAHTRSGVGQPGQRPQSEADLQRQQHQQRDRDQGHGTTGQQSEIGRFVAQLRPVGRDHEDHRRLQPRVGHRLHQRAQFDVARTLHFVHLRRTRRRRQRNLQAAVPERARLELAVAGDHPPVVAGIEARVVLILRFGLQRKPAVLADFAHRDQGLQLIGQLTIERALAGFGEGLAQPQRHRQRRR